MNKIFARGGIEFIAVLLGLTLSLWIDENAKKMKQLAKTMKSSVGYIKIYALILPMEHGIKKRTKEALRDAKEL